ncbi:MAG: hypothetical protein H7A52_17620 [Akkermansiaceae bacterium]|nr:hypothetical protein [Akkermansiaceae bacterium]
MSKLPPFLNRLLLPIRRPFFFSLPLAIAAAALAQNSAELPVNPMAEMQRAYREGDFDRLLKLTEKLEEDSPLLAYRAAALHQRGERHFFEGRIAESIDDFDASLKLQPDREPYDWQRGISYYYAGEFENGKKQFEIHQTVNPQDVENAVFHFICTVRAPGGSVESAREHFIQIEGDPRVPMREIWSFYAGKGSAEAVIDAANAGNPPEDERLNRLCYAHLYLGLYYDSTGDAEKAAEHIRLAAGKYRQDHYMGKVATVHAKLRGLTDAPKSNTQR